MSFWLQASSRFFCTLLPLATGGGGGYLALKHPLDGRTRAKRLSEAWKEAAHLRLEGLLALITTVRHFQPEKEEIYNIRASCENLRQWVDGKTYDETGNSEAGEAEG